MAKNKNSQNKERFSRKNNKGDDTFKQPAWLSFHNKNDHNTSALNQSIVIILYLCI